MTVNYCFNERVISHSFKRLIHSESRRLSLWKGYWSIDSLDSFKNVDSFSIETPLCCSETQNSSAVALIETSSANLSKNSQYCITNWELCVCLTHNEELSRWQHVYMRMCAVKTDRLGGLACEMRCIRFEQHSADRSAHDIKVPRERFESMRSHLLSVALVVLLKSNQERDFGRTHLWSSLWSMSFQFLSQSLHAPPPPPKKKTLRI